MASAVGLNTSNGALLPNSNGSNMPLVATVAAQEQAITTMQEQLATLERSQTLEQLQLNQLMDTTSLITLQSTNLTTNCHDPNHHFHHR